MNNQAAQTMPELPVSRGYLSLYHSGGVAVVNGYTAAQMHQYARDYAAALSQTAGVADVKDRKDAERYRWLRDTQTSYGISAQYDDAGSPLIWLRFSGYGSNGEGTDAAIDRAMLAAASAASGGERPEPDARCNCGWGDVKDHLREECSPKDEAPHPPAAASVGGVHPDALPDGTLSKSTAKRLAAASVSERARELLAAEYAAEGWNTEANACRRGISDAVDRFALRAIEQALTQQRGAASYNAGMAMHWIERYAAGIDEECQLDRIAEAFTTPQPSADAVREIYDAAAKGFHTSETNGAERKYLHVIRFHSIEDLHCYEDAWTAAMVKARDAK